MSRERHIKSGGRLIKLSERLIKSRERLIKSREYVEGTTYEVRVPSRDKMCMSLPGFRTIRIFQQLHVNKLANQNV